MAENDQVPDIEVTDNYPSGLKVTTDLPYRTLFVAPLTADASDTLDAGVIEINAENFDSVMAKASPAVTFNTSDPTRSGNVMTEVALRFESMKSFQPQALAEQLAPTRPLMAVRGAVVERLQGKIKSDALNKKIAEASRSGGDLAWLSESLAWQPDNASADPDAVDSLLGQLDLGDDDGGAAKPPTKSPIGKVVAAAAQDGSSIPAEEASALRHTLGEIDRRVSAWLNHVLHAPQVKRLEESWRSLRFLVANTEFRKGLRLSILHAAPDDLLERFRTKLIDPVFDEGAPAPDLIVVDHLFGQTAPDMEALDELAQHGASLPAIVITSASADFFGIKHVWQVPTLPALNNMFDQWQFAKWKTLRGQSYSRALGVFFGRCLLRGKHERKEQSDLSFSFREEATADKDFVWGNGALAAAVTVARSFTECGWPTRMSGFVHGRVEGFSKAMGGKKGDKTFGPTDTELAQDKIEEMALVGLCATVGLRDHEDAVVWNGLTCARPMKLDHEGLLEISLPYQLFAARLSGLLFNLKPHLERQPAEKVKQIVTQHVRDWLKLPAAADEETLSVLTRPAEDAPQSVELAVTVTPPTEILPGGIPVGMGYRIG